MAEACRSEILPWFAALAGSTDAVADLQVRLAVPTQEEAQADQADHASQVAVAVETVKVVLPEAATGEVGCARRLNCPASVPPMLIGVVLDKYCITGTMHKMVDGQDQVITLYNYSIPMLIFACFGMLAIVFAFLLKAEDRKKGYGLELPNVKDN